MPQIYINDETRAKLDILTSTKVDNRTITGEIEYLCDERLKQLNIPENATPSVDKDSNFTPNGIGSQGINQ